MANHNRYKKDSLSITPDGGSAVTPEHVEAITFEKGGETIDVLSDGGLTVEEIALHAQKGGLTIRMSFVDQDIDLGLCVVFFDMELVKSGTGAQAGAARRVTFPKAVLRRVGSEVMNLPGGSLNYELDCADDGSGNIYTIEDAA